MDKDEQNAKTGLGLGGAFVGLILSLVWVVFGQHAEVIIFSDLVGIFSFGFLTFFLGLLLGSTNWS